MSNGTNSIWTPALTDDLRTRWTAGETTGDIARAMGIGTNQVIGKAHRMGLSSRPSPIKPASVRRSPRARPVRSVVLSAPAPMRACCLWPLWGARERPTHVYCDEPRDGGRVYCAKHSQIAFTTQPQQVAA